MSQFNVLFKKECLSSRRDFKWLWMPIVFIILGVTEPLTAYYMPAILDSVGNLPEGTVIEIPLPSASEVMVSAIGQFNMFGVLVIILGFMSSVAGERANGLAAMVLVKPVSYYSYIIAKWAAALLFVWISYFLGLLASWYYTYQLFEMVDIMFVLEAFFVYGLWLTFIVSLVIFFGSFASNGGMTAFYSLGIVIVMSFISVLLSQRFVWSPALLMNEASELLTTGAKSNHLLPMIITTVGLILILLYSAIKILRRKELA